MRQVMHKELSPGEAASILIEESQSTRATKPNRQ